jgi:isopentenyldiphosphate isomerase
MDAENLFEEIALYDIEGRQIGKIDRKTAHNSKEYLHGAVHIFVFNSKNEILLQKRSLKKLVMPGRFDISAGGHIGYKESEYKAALRELEEELGIKDAEVKFLYDYIWESEIEREYVFTFMTFWDGPIDFLRSEIDEVRFFKVSDINKDDLFTPNLLYELELLRKRSLI